MLDLRPIGYVIGLMVMMLGASMALPLLIDLAEGTGHWPAFLQAGILSALVGGLVALACSNGNTEALNIQQTFLLTTGVWLMLPVFGALPFMFGATELRFVDAFFEAMSGLTTTGATVISGLDDLPKGLLLWRGLLQWLGGIGIIVVAMVFLPELRVGGMQIFRAEGFDTMGKILPRATAIAAQVSYIYLGISLICALVYFALGMSVFDATVHAMTTVATGGFANYDASFGAFPPQMEYAAALFMILAALPFVRYVQLINGNQTALFRDAQIRGFVATLLVLVALCFAVLTFWQDRALEVSLRQALFNITSIVSGTGYASTDYMLWGPFLVALFFFIGLIGGCAGSTACSIKIFRYQLLFASVRAQVRRIHSPNGVFTPKYDGRPVSEDVLGSVMSFFIFFIVTMGALAVALSFTGLDLITSLSGSAAALANIGPGLGDIIGPSGNYGSLNDLAKWLLVAGMLIGRLELMAVYAILTLRFWRG